MEFAFFRILSKIYVKIGKRLHFYIEADVASALTRKSGMYSTEIHGRMWFNPFAYFFKVVSFIFFCYKSRYPDTGYDYFELITPNAKNEANTGKTLPKMYSVLSITLMAQRNALGWSANTYPSSVCVLGRHWW